MQFCNVIPLCSSLKFAHVFARGGKNEEPRADSKVSGTCVGYIFRCVTSSFDPLWNIKINRPVSKKLC